MLTLPIPIKEMNKRVYQTFFLVLTKSNCSTYSGHPKLSMFVNLLITNGAHHSLLFIIIS